jgi:hypothetical protein
MKRLLGFDIAKPTSPSGSVGLQGGGLRRGRRRSHRGLQRSLSAACRAMPSARPWTASPTEVAAAATSRPLGAELPAASLRRRWCRRGRLEQCSLSKCCILHAAVAASDVRKRRLPPLAGGRDGSRGGSCARRQRTRKTGRRRLHHAGLPEITLRRKLRLMTDLPASVGPSHKLGACDRAQSPLTHNQPSRNRQPANATERQ